MDGISAYEELLMHLKPLLGSEREAITMIEEYKEEVIQEYENSLKSDNEFS